MKEIGSDFWNIEGNKNTAFFLAGRTAEEYIIRDILKEKRIISALLPSLICHTMIEPFLRNGVSVRFYDVLHENGLKAVLPERKENEAILFLDYFGYGQITGLERVHEWDVTIEDCTHSWMSKEISDADYSYISYRKWTGFTAISNARRRKGAFSIQRFDKQHDEYEKLRYAAIFHKKEYLENGTGKKDKYLDEFTRAEELLSRDYVDYAPTKDSLENLITMDKDFIREQRRTNAQILIEGLKDVEGIEFLFPKIRSYDVPLNVPVFVKDGLRDELRKFLIKKDIFCPVHWPLSKMHIISGRAKEMYDGELSLVCDQRYKAEDIKREVAVIRDFYCKGNLS